MIRDFDISSLRTFIAVAEHLNMTNASLMRHLTQSAVSQQIKKLETLLDEKLLIRRPKGIELTRSGEAFLPHARLLVQLNDEAFAEMTNSPVTRNIRLGVPSDVVSSLLPQILKNFQAANPDTQITLISKNSVELLHLLELEQVDIALTTDRETTSDATLLFRKPLIWIGAIEGQAHLQTPLPVAVGRVDCPFRMAASDALSNARLPWRAVTQVGSLEPVFATLMADMAVAPFMPGTMPYGTCQVEENLPTLPNFSLQMRKQKRKTNATVERFWNLLGNTLGE